MGPDGKVVRYVRPRGPGGPLDCKRKHPSGIAYEPDLYHLPDIADPLASQHLEHRFFQLIDDRAAKAFAKLDKGERGRLEDRIALTQFMVSLLHRSPSRLRAIREELTEKTVGSPYENAKGEEFSRLVKATANRFLASLVESDEGVRIVGSFKIFVVKVLGTDKSFLTSDRPISASSQLVNSDAFMAMPYAPQKMIILAHNPEIARAFSSQNASRLISGINQAVVEQAEDIIVACDTRASRMIERLFNRPQVNRQKDPVGLIRRKSPFVDLRPKIENFSRHRKHDILYRERSK